MRNDDIDVLLRRALSSKETPDKALIRKIKFEVSKEEPDLRKFNARHSFRTVAGIALALVLFTTTAFAAWYLWKPSEVADHLGDDALSVAFESEDAININESAASGDYIFTLLAVVSGKDITDFLHYSNVSCMMNALTRLWRSERPMARPCPTAWMKNTGTRLSLQLPS